METTNFKKDDNQELENPITNPETVESINETPESTNDSFDTDNLEEKVIALEGEIKEHVDKTNEVRASLDLPKISAEDIPSLKKKINIWEDWKGRGKNFVKAGLVAAMTIFPANEAVGQTNKTPDKNPEKTEVKTEVSSFYDRLQEYNIIPSSMTAVEFQKKAEDPDQSWFKSVTDQYRKARGMMSVEDAAEWNKNNPEAKVIEKRQYVYHTLSELEIQADLAKKAEITEENKTKALEEVWKKQKKGQYKMGDTVNLVYEDADGNKIETKYVVKIYPKDKKENKKENKANSNSDSNSSVATKFVKDRLGN